MGSLVAGALAESVVTASFGASPTDWSVWNLQWTKSATKSLGGATITNPVVVGGGLSDSFGGSSVTVRWTGGSISSTGVVTGGIYVDGTAAGSFSVGVGYSLTFPADTTPRNAIIYFGVFNCQAWVTATLSDGSATPLTLTTTAVAAGNTNTMVCDFTYAANGAGQTLQIKVTMQVATTVGVGNVQLQAAAYSTGAAVAAVSYTFMLLGAGSG